MDTIKVYFMTTGKKIKVFIPIQEGPILAISHIATIETEEKYDVESEVDGWLEDIAAGNQECPEEIVGKVVTLHEI